MNIIFIVLVYLFILILDFIPILKSKRILLICVYGVLFISSFIGLYLSEKHVEIPTIGKPIRDLIGSVFNLK